VFGEAFMPQASSMKTSFRIMGLPLQPFAPLFELNETELAKRGARRLIADKKPGFPCRVSLQDADPGEAVILLPFAHHAIESPYRASGPIFVREAADEASLAPGEIPAVLPARLLSMRGYDKNGMMLSANVVEGREIKAQIENCFADARINYIHLHNAGPGCYSCRVERV
jgi:hypothetical protein